MGKKAGDHGEYEFTRAAYDELRDTETRYQVVFDLTLTPSDQRGVWLLAVTAMAKGEHEILALVSRYQAAWPNSIALSFGAFEYQCCHRVCRMVEAWWQQREHDEAAQNSRG